MNGGTAPLTSEQQMNVFRWRDKMTLLNSEFMQVFKYFYDEKQHYDFTGTMESYKDHVKQLRNMYNMPEGPQADMIPAVEKPKDVVQSTSTPAPGPAVSFQRKIAKATRRNAVDTPKVMNSTVIESTSPMKAPPMPKFGDISVIAKETPAPISKTLSKPAAAEEPAPTARKRAIRGGGPLGGSESVVFKSSGGEEKSTSSTTKIPEVTIKFPEPTKDFWTKKDDTKNDGGSLFAFLGKDNDNSSKFTGFSFGKKPTDSSEKSPESAPKPASLFGAKPVESSPTKPLSFGEPKPAETVKPLSFGGITKPAETLKPLSFGGSPSSETVKPLSFGGSKPAEPTKPLSFGEPKPAETSPAKPLSSLFGSSGSSTLSFGGSNTPSAPPALSFGSSGLFAGLAQKAMENKGKEGENNDEEGEYVPPKAEAVENEEPDAVLSSKVSVFKFTGKEYSKLGVGMLHIKSTDSKHSLLIRAATTTGTVWLNALCNAAMKATKIDEKGDRIRLTCPVSMSEMTTMMIRFGTAEGAKKFLDKIDEVSK